ADSRCAIGLMADEAGLPGSTPAIGATSGGRKRPHRAIYRWRRRRPARASGHPGSRGRFRMTTWKGRALGALLMSLASALPTAVAPVVALAATSPSCPQVATTVTCTYLSGSHLLVITAGVTTVHVVAVGGHGGQNGFGVEGDTNSVAGRGAVVTG